MNHFIEIRSLNLKPGTRDKFHQLYIDKALSLLQQWNFDVVAHGPSQHDENTYYLMRRLTAFRFVRKVKTLSMEAMPGEKVRASKSLR